MSDVDCMSCLVAMGQGMPSSATYQDYDHITHGTLIIRRQEVGDYTVDYRDARVLACSLAQHVRLGGIPLHEVRSVPR